MNSTDLHDWIIIVEQTAWPLFCWLSILAVSRAAVAYRRISLEEVKATQQHEIVKGMEYKA